jgi:hypothetical protein
MTLINTSPIPNGHEINYLSTNESFNSSRFDISKRKRLKIWYDEFQWYDGEVNETFIPDGYGEYHYPNGDIYEGNFNKGVKNGKGEYKYIDGSHYRGQWRRDIKHGFGCFKCENFRCDGQWENDGLIFGITISVSLGDKSSNDLLQFKDESDQDECIGMGMGVTFNSGSGELDDTMEVKTFVDKVQKRMKTLHSFTKTKSYDFNIDVIKTNFKKSKISSSAKPKSSTFKMNQEGIFLIHSNTNINTKSSSWNPFEDLSLKCRYCLKLENIGGKDECNCKEINQFANSYSSEKFMKL